MMNYYGNSIMGTGFGILMMVFWALILIGAVLLVIWGIRRMSSPQITSQKDSACEIARVRYAKGEITKQEYDEICQTLGV
ncbi:MAG: SHOCT domain-containing protein [Actinobacteria bacterium]|nr:SHOCT domain-containing protein [Actinomycetota bacterium]